jgi:hypothetical protein
MRTRLGARKLPHRGKRFSLSVEQLEDRCLLSALNTLTDTPAIPPSARMPAAPVAVPSQGSSSQDGTIANTATSDTYDSAAVTPGDAGEYQNAGSDKSASNDQSLSSKGTAAGAGQNEYPKVYRPRAPRPARARMSIHQRRMEWRPLERAVRLATRRTQRRTIR